MSFSFKNVSIKYKITLWVMSACLVTLSVGYFIALRNDLNILRKDFKEITRTKALLMGEYSISPLVFHDKNAALKNLKIGAQSIDYKSIELYDDQGNIFVKLGDTESKVPSHIRLTVDTTHFIPNKHEIKFSHVIKHDGHVFGFLILHASTFDLEEEISRDIKVLILSGLLITLVGGVLIYFTQRAVSVPIYRLVKYLDVVAENSNISKTIHIKRGDEIGSIYNAINKLLNKIHHNEEEKNNYIETIQKNNDKLGRTLDAFSDGHWEYNVASGHWFFSDAWLHTFGYQRTELDFENEEWEKLIHPDDLMDYNVSLNKHLEGKDEYFNTQFRILSKKGGYRWVKFKGHWVEKEDGKVTDMLGITYDIQESRDFESLKKEANQRAINDSKIEALRHMVVGISHSLKNILSPVVGYADYGLQTVDNNGIMTKELKQIRESALKANNIVEDMLCFSEVTLDLKTNVELTQLVDKSIENREFNPKGIVYELKNNLSKATVFGDSRKLGQMMTHLLLNAEDASFEGDRVKVILDYLEVSQKNKEKFSEVPVGEYVSIEIADTGEGIDEENLNRIFEPFFSTKEIGMGVGLGLSVVKGIITAHNGYIFVTSALYRGTKVLILIPTL